MTFFFIFFCEFCIILGRIIAYVREQALFLNRSQWVIVVYFQLLLIMFMLVTSPSIKHLIKYSTLAMNDTDRLRYGFEFDRTWIINFVMTYVHVSFSIVNH